MYLYFKFFFWLSLILRKNPTLRNLTSEKHFMKLIFYKDDKLYIKFFQKIFFYAFNTVIKLFFTVGYKRITTLTWIFHDHPLVEYPLSENKRAKLISYAKLNLFKIQNRIKEAFFNLIFTRNRWFFLLLELTTNRLDLQFCLFPLFYNF